MWTIPVPSVSTRATRCHDYRCATNKGWWITSSSDRTAAGMLTSILHDPCLYSIYRNGASLFCRQMMIQKCRLAPHSIWSKLAIHCSLIIIFSVLDCTTSENSSSIQFGNTNRSVAYTRSVVIDHCITHWYWYLLLQHSSYSCCIAL